MGSDSTSPHISTPVRVAFPLSECFDYAAPFACPNGTAVIAPLGARKLIGYVIEQLASSPHKLRPIERIAEEIPPLPAELLKLAHFISEYYCAPLTDVLRMIVPTPMRRKLLRSFKLSASGKSLVEAQPDHPLATLKRLRTPASMRQKLKLSAKEMEAQLQEWVRDGFVIATEKLSIGAEGSAPKSAHKPSAMVPRAEQAAALTQLTAALDANAYKGFLLWGVTGSGKTEVYLSAIAHALAQGKTAIVLVPEIGLTPQLEARFAARLGNDVVTIHSGLTVKQRRDAWARVQAGDAPVVVGPRSALFAPLRNIGIIIVDEEHDDSYKQDETPRYHARDVALVRAHELKAVAILGSATPAIETINNVRLGKLTCIRMKERATGGALPDVEVVRLGPTPDPDAPRAPREHKSGRDARLFSDRLTELVVQTKERGEQTILFLNRRGFAPFVLCQSCGQGFKCPNCSVALTHHLKRNVMLCHYCDHAEPAPVECPHCKSHNLRISGSGTERLEMDLRRVFPTFSIGRLDRDVVDIKAVLQQFREGHTDILVGTQMVTKGHDFPKVTLVGVLLADSGLNFPDFRAAERTAQMLVQVGGRSGRADLHGRVVVQTYHPDHPAIEAARTHDYETFVQQELEDREALEYPPFAKLILLRFQGDSLEDVQAGAEALANELKAEVLVLGPSPCPLARLRGLYRYMLLLKGAKSGPLRQALARAAKAVAMPNGVQLVVDVDPVAML